MVATFGMFAWAYTALCVALAVKAAQSETLKDKGEVVTSMSWNAGISFLVGLALVWIGYKLAVGAGGYNSRDPNEPMMKF